MALKTYTVTNEPGHTAGVAPAPGLDPAAAEGLAPAEGFVVIVGRGGGRSQIGARTHMSMTYSSRCQQVAVPS